MREINYPKEALTHTANYVIIGVILFLMIFTMSFWGLLYLLVGLELGVWLLSFTEPVRRILYLQNYNLTQSEMKSQEDAIFEHLPSKFQSEYQKISRLCSQIELRNQNSGHSDTTELSQKLAELRYKFVKLLEMYNICSNTGELKSSKIAEITAGLDDMNKQLKTERNPRVSSAITANISILNKRLDKLRKSGDRLRELDTQLDLIKNSLELLNEDAISLDGIGDVTDSVDGLLSNIEIEEPDYASLTLDNLKKPTEENVVEFTKKRSA